MPLVSITCHACGFTGKASRDAPGAVVCPRCEAIVPLPARATVVDAPVRRLAPPASPLPVVRVETAPAVRSAATSYSKLQVATGFLIGLGLGCFAALAIIDFSTPDRVRQAEEEAARAIAAADEAAEAQWDAEDARDQDLKLLRDSNETLLEQMDLSERRRLILVEILKGLGWHFDSEGEPIFTGKPDSSDADEPPRRNRDRGA